MGLSDDEILTLNRLLRKVIAAGTGSTASPPEGQN
jgi:hypothetical protein